jgi:predicted alpha/beta hydrolase family esterase
MKINGKRITKLKKEQNHDVLIVAHSLVEITGISAASRFMSHASPAFWTARAELNWREEAN